MARAKAAKVEEPKEAETEGEEGGDEDVLPESTIICALTGEPRKDTPEEQTIQSVIEQLLREYEVAPEDMERDVRSRLEIEDARSGVVKTRRKVLALAVYERGAEHTQANIIRVAVVAKPGVKPASKTGTIELDQILRHLNDRDQLFGLWTNGADLCFRMRTFHRRSLEPVLTDLTDFPAPDETLDDLETADRRPLRIASGDSLLRTFKRCHDYLYGNQAMRGDRAFWQLLYLIFAKILDEDQSRRAFFVGATEGNTDEGRRKVAKRIHALFAEAKSTAYADVFDGPERIELNDRALAYIAGELGRYSLLSTDTDAKGTAYEAITSTTLKRERGQFFTPRNVIRMMVEMLDPQPGQRILDPACGSGGFLVVALAHARRRMLIRNGCPDPEAPMPSELRAVRKEARDYARKCLYGIDVDPELRKAARMNMVMNNDGYGNIGCFNSLEYGVKARRSDPMSDFERRGGGHGKFDFVVTNPPFGAKIPVDDPEVLEQFDLGHRWIRSGNGWVKGERQRRVAPEILFIENCWKFLKTDGVMAIVLPNGILGNPGEQMEAVRSWMLERMELLASVDLPAEAFLPQVSVQASCVFLRRRAPDEGRMAGPTGPPQRPVFMAIAEQCGHGRRDGEKRYIRRPDGAEHLEEKLVTERWEKGNRIETRQRRQMVRVLADDMPWIARQYRKHRTGEPFEGS